MKLYSFSTISDPAGSPPERNTIALIKEFLRGKLRRDGGTYHFVESRFYIDQGINGIEKRTMLYFKRKGFGFPRRIGINAEDLMFKPKEHEYVLPEPEKRDELMENGYFSVGWYLGDQARLLPNGEVFTPPEIDSIYVHSI